MINKMKGVPFFCRVDERCVMGHIVRVFSSQQQNWAYKCKPFGTNENVDTIPIKFLRNLSIHFSFEEIQHEVSLFSHIS